MTNHYHNHNISTVFQLNDLSVLCYTILPAAGKECNSSAVMSPCIWTHCVHVISLGHIGSVQL